MKLHFLLTVCYSLMFIGCQSTETVDTESNIDVIFEAYDAFKKRINPIESTKGGYELYNDHVANYISDEYIADLKKEYTQFLNTIATFDSTNLDETQWLSMKVMEWDCKIKLEGLSNELVIISSPMYNLPNFELTPIIQIQSLHLYFSQLAGGTSVHPFMTVKDYEDWLSRIDDYLIFLDTAKAKMRKGIDQGVVLPSTLIAKVIPQLEQFISGPVEEHIFYKPITQMPDEFSDVDRYSLTAAYKAVIAEKVIPAYASLRDFMRNKYLPRGRSTSGIGVLPNGEKTYDYLIRLHTTTKLTADEIHELGLSEVKRIKVEMEQAMKATGFKGTINEFFEHIRNASSQMPFTAPEQVIANFESIHERIKPQLLQVFDLEPRATFNIKRTESFREASASAEYVPGSKDASRPGTFYVPIPDVKRYNKYTDEALFLHEAVPGHHYQLSLQQENKSLPGFLHPESLGVFVEGWALYAESLGSELGLYEDPYQYFGMLSMEMHRAIRLVVDSGIHAKGWSREKAIQYSLENEAESESSIIASIERYMATPGQALSYKIGQLKIRELRSKAEQILGDRFSVQEFHNQVLNSGSLPLVLLETKINNWIKIQMN